MNKSIPIEGKVAQIISERDLAINRGSDHGVEIGMKFRILSKKGIAIVDPDTHAPIGSVEVEKTSVKIVEVHERVSVGRTFKTIKQSGMIANSYLNQFRLATETFETLKDGGNNSAPDLDEKDSLVKVGDLAVEDILADENSK